MYLCSICGACSKPGQSRKVWVVERTVPHMMTDCNGYEIKTTRTEIEQEIPICHNCYDNLKHGSTLPELRECYKPRPGPVKLDAWPERETVRVSD